MILRSLEKCIKERIDKSLFVKNPDQNHQVFLKGDTDTILTDPDPKIPAFGLELFKVGQFRYCFCLFNVLYYSLNLPEKFMVFLVLAQIF